MDSNQVLDLERDLQYCEASAADLKDYLLSATLYWPLRSGRSRMLLPKGTIGGLLLRLHRLDKLQHLLDGDLPARYHHASTEAKNQLSNYQFQAQEKAQRDLKARLNIWQAYLEDLQNSPKRHQPAFPTQCEGRTAARLLLDFLGSKEDISSAQQKLRKLDAALRELTTESAFIWAPEMAPAFPEDPFWWLYVSPRLTNASPE